MSEVARGGDPSPRVRDSYRTTESTSSGRARDGNWGPRSRPSRRPSFSCSSFRTRVRPDLARHSPPVLDLRVRHVPIRVTMRCPRHPDAGCLELLVRGERSRTAFVTSSSFVSSALRFARERSPACCEPTSRRDALRDLSAAVRSSPEATLPRRVTSLLRLHLDLPALTRLSVTAPSSSWR